MSHILSTLIFVLLQKFFLVVVYAYKPKFKLQIGFMTNLFWFSSKHIVNFFPAV